LRTFVCVCVFKRWWTHNFIYSHLRMYILVVCTQIYTCIYLPVSIMYAYYVIWISHDTLHFTYIACYMLHIPWWRIYKRHDSYTRDMPHIFIWETWLICYMSHIPCILRSTHTSLILQITYTFRIPCYIYISYYIVGIPSEVCLLCNVQFIHDMELIHVSLSRWSFISDHVIQQVFDKSSQIVSGHHVI
jgi:hypothetical protein